MTGDGHFTRMVRQERARNRPQIEEKELQIVVKTVAVGALVLTAAAIAEAAVGP